MHTKSLLAGERSCECDAVWPPRGDVQGREVGVVSRHRNWPALRMDSLRRVASSAVEDDVVHALVDGGQGDVVIQELAVLHQHEGVAGVEVRHVGVDHDGDEAGGGQGLVTN